MSDSWSSIASVELADHEIHLFYELHGVTLRGPNTTLSELVIGKPDCFPADQREALGGRYADLRIWREAVVDIGPDIYEYLRDIIAGRRKDLATVWSLVPQVQHLISTADLYEENRPVEQRVRKRLDLTPGKRASARLLSHSVQPRSLTLAIDSVVLHVFATGVSFAHVVVRLRPAEGGKPLTPIELLEGQVAITRFDRLSWRPLSGGPNGEAAAFSLGLLIRRLVLGAAASASDTERAKTYTYLRLAAPMAHADADLLALHLARHYTTDYAVDANIGGLTRVRAFATVGHVLSLEGATTIVAPVDPSGPLPGFLEKFKEVTLRSHYVPIALLGFHEYCFLIDRTSRSVLNPQEERDVNRTLAVLARLISDSLVFRVCFRFTQVSHITMHNEMNRGFREALGLDRMLREFGADVTEIEAFLRTVEEHKARTRFYVFSMIGGASLAALSGLTIFRQAAGVLFEYDGVQAFLYRLLSPAITTGWIQWPLREEKVGLLFGVAIFVIALWLLGRRRPLAHVEAGGESTMHALIEQMVKESKKDPGG